MPQSRLDKNCIKITKMSKNPINLRQSVKIPNEDLQTNLRFVDSHQLLKLFSYCICFVPQMFVQEAGGLLRIWCFFTSIAELSTLSPAMNKKENIGTTKMPKCAR